MLLKPAHSEVDNIYQVYIIDFGLAKKYRDPSTHQHIPYRYLFIIFLEHHCASLLLLGHFCGMQCSPSKLVSELI